jgi:hypothetical protein
VRIEVGQPCRCKGIPKYGPDGGGVAPARSCQPRSLEPPIGARNDLRFRKERIAQPPLPFDLEERYPFLDDLDEIFSNREEPSIDHLGGFGTHLPRVLPHHPVGDVDVLQEQRSEGVIASSCKYGKGDQRSVPLFDITTGRHASDDMPNLLQGRPRDFIVRTSSRGLLERQAEVVAIRVPDPAAVARLIGQPDEEGAQSGQDM